MRKPRQLSGGQKQRVAIARALAGDPDLLVADEPVSALDVSVQAAIINLLMEIQAKRDATLVFISHDLSVVRYLADHVAVMYLGKIVEFGSVDDVFSPPYHPYTEALLSAVPVADPDVQQKRIILEGSMPSVTEIPAGCPFSTRCPRKVGAICETTPPPEQQTATGHRIACHIPLTELSGVEPVIPRRRRSSARPQLVTDCRPNAAPSSSIPTRASTMPSPSCWRWPRPSSSCSASTTVLGNVSLALATDNAGGFASWLGGRTSPSSSRADRPLAGPADRRRAQPWQQRSRRRHAAAADHGAGGGPCRRLADRHRDAPPAGHGDGRRAGAAHQPRQGDGDGAPHRAAPRRRRRHGRRLRHRQLPRRRRVQFLRRRRGRPPGDGERLPADAGAARPDPSGAGDAARLAALAGIAAPIGPAVAAMLRYYSDAALPFGLAGGALHDACVIAWLLQPGLFTGRPAHVRVETGAARIGVTVEDRRPVAAAAPNCRVLERLDADGFFALLTERLARLSAAP